MLAPLTPHQASVGRSVQWARRRPAQAGRALLEALIGAATGAALVSSALSVYLMQFHAVREALQRQRQTRDAQDLLEHLRREIRRAGHVREGGLTTEQQAITQDGTPSSLQVHYRSDPVESDRPTGRASFRLAQGVMQWRTPSTGGYQQLLDAQSLALRSWALQPEPSPGDCAQPVRIRFQGTGVDTAWETLVQRRNHGVMPCEDH